MAHYTEDVSAEFAQVVERAQEIRKVMADRPDLSPELSIAIAVEGQDYAEVAALYLAMYATVV